MKTLKRINHLFTGHGLFIDYDEKYLYCDCGKKIEHYGQEIVKDWVFPYLDTLKDKRLREKLRFGAWFFKWNNKRLKKALDKVNFDAKDIKITSEE